MAFSLRESVAMELLLFSSMPESPGLGVEFSEDTLSLISLLDTYPCKSEIKSEISGTRNIFQNLQLVNRGGLYNIYVNPILADLVEKDYVSLDRRWPFNFCSK